MAVSRCTRKDNNNFINMRSYFALQNQVVKDVVLTINQAIEPVEKGMTKNQETFHQISVSGNKEDSEVKMEEEDSEVKVEEHEQNITGDGYRVLHSEDKIVTKATDRIEK